MKKKNETPIYLGFASQKGGVGKSSGNLGGYLILRKEYPSCCRGL